MPTVSKTFTWTSDEGLVDVGDSGNLLGAFSSSDQALEWTTTGAFTSAAERARKSATTDTWETLFAVPAGAVVTQVQVTGWDERKWATANMTTRRVRIRVVDSGGVTVHSAGELFDTGATSVTSDGGIPAAMGAGTARAVDAGSQPSSSPVRLEVAMDLVTTGTPTIDLEQDNVVVVVTYALVASPAFDLPSATGGAHPSRMPLGMWVPETLQAEVAAAGAASVGQAVEVDEAQPIGRVKTLAVAQAAETELAQPVSAVRSRMLGQALETDLAQPFGRLKRRTLGQPVEADTAQQAARSKLKTLGQPVETDVGQQVGRARSRTLGQPSEVDTAQPISRAKKRLIGEPAETDLAEPVGRVKAKLLGQPAETDLAQPISHPGAGQLGQAVEADSANAVARVKTRTVGQSADTETAQPIRTLKVRQIGQLAEADAALSVLRLRSLTVRQATETAQAQAVARIKRVLLGQAVEIEAALAIVAPSTTVLVIAGFGVAGHAGAAAGVRALAGVAAGVVLGAGEGEVIYETDTQLVTSPELMTAGGPPFLILTVGVRGSAGVAAAARGYAGATSGARLAP